MSKGLEKLIKDAKRAGIEIRTVSCEPTSYNTGQYPINRSGWERALTRLFNAYAPKRDNGWREYGVNFENDIFWVHVDYQGFGDDCACAYRDNEKLWISENSHCAECFQPYISNLVTKLKDANPLPEFSFFRAVDAFEIAEMLHMFHGGPESSEDIREKHKVTEAQKEEEQRAYNIASDRRAEKIRNLVMAEASKRNVTKGQSVALEERNADWMWEHLCTCGFDKAHHEWRMAHHHSKPCELWWAVQPNFLHKPSGYSVHWYKYPCREAYGNMEISLQRFQSIIRSCIKSIEEN